MKIAKDIKSCLKSLYLLITICLFAKGAHYALYRLARESDYHVFSLDWNYPIEAVQAVQGTGKCLQGNLDVSILYGSEQVIRKEVRKMLDQFGTQGYIANLGHGMLPDHPVEGLEIFVDEVHNYSKFLIETQKKNEKKEKEGKEVAATNMAVNSTPSTTPISS